MTRLRMIFPRRARGGDDPRGHLPEAEAGAAGPADDGTAVLVDQRHGLLLLRASPAARPGPDDVAELGRSLAAAETGRETVTVVLGAEDGLTPVLWSRLSDTLDVVQADGCTTVRLVLSGAGRGTADEPALAQRIADGWQLRVIAPEGLVLIVPGGSMFVSGQMPGGGWRLFAPDTAPRPLGARNPSPDWQEALEGLPERTATGCLVEQIPAGVLVRSPAARTPQPGDLFHAAPVDPRHPLVLVAGAEGEEVSPDDLSALLAALPEAVRAQVRLAPGDHRDLLPPAQAVADLSGTEVEVLTGLPLLSGSPAADAPADARPFLIGRDADPAWQPFVEAVACRPARPADTGPGQGPRLLRWRSPIPGLASDQQGTVHLSESWQVRVERAGLHVCRRGQSRPFGERPVSADRLAVDIGLAGEALDESVLPALSRLLSGLGPELRGYVTLQVLGRLSDGERRLGEIAARHGVRLHGPAG